MLLQTWVGRLSLRFWFIISLAAKSKMRLPLVLFSAVGIPGNELYVCCFSDGGLLLFLMLFLAIAPWQCANPGPVCLHMPALPFLCSAPCNSRIKPCRLDWFSRSSLSVYFCQESTNGRFWKVEGRWRQGPQLPLGDPNVCHLPLCCTLGRWVVAYCCS